LSAPARENVVLVGFMGSGKSSVGRLLARALGGRFVDTDKLVVERAGMPIPDIFAHHGEPWFRRAETGALRSLIGGIRLVVATGGGVVTIPENVAVLKELGFVVWLTASEEVIWSRVSRNKNRPLLHTDNPRETVRDLLEKRNPLYDAVADLKIETTELTHAQVAEKIWESMRV
jgi:shikimate kinase